MDLPLRVGLFLSCPLVVLFLSCPLSFRCGFVKVSVPSDRRLYTLDGSTVRFSGRRMKRDSLLDLTQSFRCSTTLSQNISQSIRHFYLQTLTK